MGSLQYEMSEKSPFNDCESAEEEKEREMEGGGTEGKGSRQYSKLEYFEISLKMEGRKLILSIKN